MDGRLLLFFISINACGMWLNVGFILSLTIVTTGKALAQQKVDLYLIHLYDYHYLNHRWETNGTHEIKFKNKVTYIINKKDTILIQPRTQKRFRSINTEIKVIPIKLEQEHDNSIQFIANEKRMHFDTTLIIPTIDSSKLYLFFNIHDKEFLLIPKRKRIRINVNYPPLSNWKLHTKILSAINNKADR